MTQVQEELLKAHYWSSSPFIDREGASHTTREYLCLYLLCSKKNIAKVMIESTAMPIPNIRVIDRKEGTNNPYR